MGLIERLDQPNLNIAELFGEGVEYLSDQFQERIEDIGKSPFLELVLPITELVFKGLSFLAVYETIEKIQETPKFFVYFNLLVAGWVYNQGTKFSEEFVPKVVNRRFYKTDPNLSEAI